MFGLIVVLHVITCILLVTVILMQSGRGGGFTEGFAAAESMFGAKTSSVMVRTTTVLALIFLTTSLSLAFLSSRKGESLVIDTAQKKPIGVPLKGVSPKGKKAIKNDQPSQQNSSAKTIIPATATSTNKAVQPDNNQ